MKSSKVNHSRSSSNEQGPSISTPRPEEDTPLLASNHLETETPKTLHHGRSVFFICTSIMGLVFLLTLTNGMMMAPQQRILESVFCKYHYQEYDPSKIGPDGEVEEIWCKIPAVHRPLASLRGWLECIEAVPGIILPIPFGVLADRIGRKRVLLMGLVGLFLQFFSIGFILFFHNTISIQWILLSPLFELVGGGASVSISTAYTMIADTVAPEERAVVYFRLSACAMLGPLVAYPSAALLMGISPYLSILIGMIVSCIFVLIAIPLPETLNLEEARKKRMIAAEERGPLPKKTVAQKIRAGSIHLVHSTKALLHHHAVIWLLPLFLIAAATNTVMDFLLQYASEKFQWSFKNASMLPEIHIFVNAILLMFILPVLSHFLTKTRNMTSARKDLFITRCCILITLVGLFLVGLAPSMTLLVLSIIFYSLGGGFLPSTRSILVGLVRPEQNARLFAVCGTLTYLGSFISAPILARVYGWALDKGGIWLGAPFWAADILVLLAAIPLFTLNFQGDEQDDLAITTAVTQDSMDQSDALTLVSDEAEEERERERLGTKFVYV